MCLFFPQPWKTPVPHPDFRRGPRTFPPLWSPKSSPKIIAVNDRNEIEEIRALLAITPLPAFLLVNCLIPNESLGISWTFLICVHSDASFPPLPSLASSLIRDLVPLKKNAILKKKKKNQKYSAQQKGKGNLTLVELERLGAVKSD